MDDLDLIADLTEQDDAERRVELRERTHETIIDGLPRDGPHPRRVVSGTLASKRSPDAGLRCPRIREQ